MNDVGRLLREAEARRAAGDLAAVERCYQQVLALGVQDAGVHAALAAAQQQQGKLAQAAAGYRSALALDPAQFAALSNLGVILRQLGEPEEAEALFRRALAVQPDSAEALCNLGVALNELERAGEAEGLLRRALAARPGFATAHYNLANALTGLGLHDEAILEYHKAIAFDAGNEDAHWNLAHVLLLRGQWHSGWAAFEHRWGIEQMREHERRVSRIAQPWWRGEDADGKTVLLHAEQGYGDSIQFVRYAPLLAERGARVLLQVQPPLERLLARVPGVARLCPVGEPLPAFDLHCPLMSLPRAFETSLQTIPARIPYVSVPEAERRRWADRLGRRRGLRVGLVWSSGLPGDDPNRFLAGVSKSLPLALFAPLARIRGVEFHSLQKGAPEREAARPPAGLKLRHWGPELRDFLDTAALIEQLDLVISVDTAVAHLAGALGKRAWVLLKFQHCWRWLQNREDSPWYPSLRLFRQPEAGDWASTLGKVAEALRAEAGAATRQGSWLRGWRG